VLIVDPDERSRSLIEATLAWEHFEITAVGSLEGAELHLAPGRPLPSVVVCEASLPGVDGFAFCKQIRDQPRTAMLPFILLSRRPEEHYPRLAGAVGADDYIARPAFARDVGSLVQLRAGASSFDTSLRSSTDVVPLPRLLRALLAGIRSGRVETESGGQITFRQGFVVDASVGQLQGMAALTRLLLFADGEYIVTFSTGPVRPSFSVGLEELVTSILPQIARWEEEAASAAPLDSKLVVNFAKLGGVLGELPAGVKELLRLCDGLRTVRRCLLESSLSEAQALAALARLRQLGVLSPLSEVASSSGERPLVGPHPFFGFPRAVEDRPPPPPERPGHPADKVARTPALNVEEVERAFFSGAGENDLRAIAGPSTKGSPIRHRVRILAAAGVVLVAIGAAWVTRKAASRRRPTGSTEVTTLSGADDKAVELAQALAQMTASHPSPASWLLLGHARLDAGDHSGAEEAANKALEINPSHGGAMMLRAHVFLAIREREKAAEDLKRYLQTAPDGPYAQEAKQLLSSW
jgi:CheY-like chemotaxis protein